MAKNGMLDSIWFYMKRGFWYSLFGSIVGVIAVALGLIGSVFIIWGLNGTAGSTSDLSLGGGIAIIVVALFVIISGAGYVMQYVVNKKKAEFLGSWWLNMKRGFAMWASSIALGFMVGIPLGLINNLYINLLWVPIALVINGYVLTRIVEEWIEE